MKNRQWLLARRPDGAIKDSDFDFVETEAPAPGEGQVLVRNLMLSCDPTQRGWIAFDTYLPAVRIGEVVRSIGAGRIEASNHPDFKIGDIVQIKKELLEDFRITQVAPGGLQYLLETLTPVVKAIGWQTEDALVLKVAVFPGEPGFRKAIIYLPIGSLDQSPAPTTCGADARN